MCGVYAEAAFLSNVYTMYTNVSKTHESGPARSLEVATPQLAMATQHFQSS